MANVFLGSVGDAYVYNKDRLFFTATTLTDSSINTGVSAEEVRGGTGGPQTGHSLLLCGSQRAIPPEGSGLHVLRIRTRQNSQP